MMFSSRVSHQLMIYADRLVLMTTAQETKRLTLFFEVSLQGKSRDSWLSHRWERLGRRSELHRPS